MIFLLHKCTLATSVIVFGVIGDLFHEVIIVDMVCTKWKCVDWCFHMHLCPSETIMTILHNYYWSMCKVNLLYEKVLWCEKLVIYLSFTIVPVRSRGPWTSCNFLVALFHNMWEIWNLFMLFSVLFWFNHLQMLNYFFFSTSMQL